SETFHVDPRGRVAAAGFDGARRRRARAARTAGAGDEGRAGHVARSRPPPSRVKAEPEAGARAGRQEHAAALRHRVFRAARASQVLAHGYGGPAQALRRSVLSVAAAELRRGAARIHAGPPEDPAVPG